MLGTMSSSETVRNIWDVYIQELSFVPGEGRERLRTACNTDDVDATWHQRSREAEASLVRSLRDASLGKPRACAKDLSPQAMLIPDAKAAVDKEWEKLEKFSAWNLTKVRNKKEVIYEARNKGRKVGIGTSINKVVGD